MNTLERIEAFESKMSAKGNVFYIMTITDGIQTANIIIWKNVFEAADQDIFKPGVGVRLSVDYNLDRKSFKISNDTTIYPLAKIEDGLEIVVDVSSEETPLI